MKVSLRVYAKALLESIHNKSKAEIKKIIDAWLYELQSKNLLRKKSQLLAEVQALRDEEKQIIRANITSARKLASSTLKQAATMIQKRTGAKEIIFQEQIETKLGGGLILHFNDTVLDASLQTVTAELAETISEN